MGLEIISLFEGYFSMTVHRHSAQNVLQSVCDLDFLHVAFRKIDLWTEEGGNKDTGVQIERGMPPLIRKVDCFAWLEGTLKQFYCLSNFRIVFNVPKN